MKRIVLILIVLFSFLGFNAPVNGDDSVKSNNSELTENFISIVKSVLGDEYSKFQENISSGAYLINGNKYESLIETLGNPEKKELFKEGMDIKIEYFHLWLSDDQNEAYLVFETKSEDDTKVFWHSILFKADKDQTWQILSWHKS